VTASQKKHDLKDAKYIKYVDRFKIDKCTINRKKKVQRIVSTAVVLLCVAFLIFGGFNLVGANTYAYVLTVNGDEIATMASEGEAQSAIDNYINQLSNKTGMKLSYDDNVKIDKISADGVVYASTADAAKALDGKMNIMADAVGVYIDGKISMYVANEDTARNAVAKVKDYYSTDAGKSLISVSVLEKIAVSTTQVALDKVLDENSAVNMLMYGSAGNHYYHVADSGCTLADVATANKIDVAQLSKLNPTLTSGELPLGTAVVLTNFDPLISVQIAKEVVEKKDLAYKTETIDNVKLARGTKNVITKGVNGKEEVTSKVVETNGVVVSSTRLSAKTLEEPVDQVVERGVKIVVASRGNGSSGILGWPLAGNITSRFGSRSLGYHTGIDIDGEVGDTVVASESGTVIFAQNDGNYGKLIKIDHGGGLVTWYAHLSKYYVSVGDEVQRGDSIGAVGVTGRTTGSHLHFEVRINDNAYNPLNYLD